MPEEKKYVYEKGRKQQELAGCLFCLGIPIVISLVVIGIFYNDPSSLFLVTIIRVAIFIGAFMVFMLCVFPAIWHMLKGRNRESTHF